MSGQPQQQQQQHHNTTSKNKSNKGQQANDANQTGASGLNRSVVPTMLFERLNKFPVFSAAVSMSFSQYDKLKSSSPVVGDAMSRAEALAAYLWTKVQPIVDKLQDPIHKADELACQTLDIVEHRLSTVKIPPTIDTIVSKCKGAASSAAATVGALAHGQTTTNVA